MHFKFDATYIKRAHYGVAMVVVNGVINDSRVLKTAQTVKKLGYNVSVYGLNSTENIEKVEGHPFEITLLPNPKFQMQREGTWNSNKQERNNDRFAGIFTEYLDEQVKKKTPAILHTHDMVGLTVGGKLIDKKGGKNIYWIHDIHEYVRGLTDLSENMRTFFSNVEDKYIRIPDALTSVSPALNKILKDYYSLGSEPATVLNAPRLMDFSPYYHKDIRSVLQVPQNAPLLVYSGNLKAVRGMQTLLDALPLLPEVHLAFISNSTGKFVNELMQNIKKMGLNNRVHFHPYVPFMNITSFLRTASIGIHPLHRYPNAEIALPNKLFEYIHAGLPAIVSNNRCMEEFINLNDCGSSFEVEDPKSLSIKVKQVLDRIYTEPNWNQFIKSLSEKYCWEAQEDVIAKIYDDFLQNISPEDHTAERKSFRILQLPVNGAGQPVELGKSMKAQGVSSSSLAIGHDKFKYKAERTIEKMPNDITSGGYIISDLIHQYDIFHFHARPLFFSPHYPFPTGIDLVSLRLAGKKIFFHFRGSEARLSSIFKKCSPYNYIDENPNKIFDKYVENEQRKFIEFVDGICSKVFVVDPELQTYVPSGLIVPRVIDLKKWSYVGVESVCEQSNDVVRVLHAPSRTVIKGTEEVKLAVEKLKSEGVRIEFKLVENVSNEEAAELYKWADIVIDQLRIGWYGVLAVEAMALGKAVVSYVRDDLKHFLPYPLPLAIANPDNLYEVLKGLASDRQEVHSLGLRGRKYVEEHHNSNYISNILLQIYMNEENSIDIDKVFNLLSFQNDEFASLKRTCKNLKRRTRSIEKGDPRVKKYYRQSFFNYLRYINKANVLRFISSCGHDGFILSLRKVYKVFFH